MKIGLYIFASLILIALIGIFAFTLNPASASVEFMGIDFNFPVAVWVILPMGILFLFTVGHIVFYGFKNYRKLKRWDNDAETLEDALYWSLVNEPKEHSYNIGEIGNSALLLNKANIIASDNVEGLTPRLAKVVNIIQKINKGEYVDLKGEKLANALKVGNPILIQNRINRLNSDEKFVDDVLRNPNNYSTPVKAKALEIFATKANFEDAKKYITIFDIKNLLVMLNRVTPSDDLGLTIEILTEFLKELKLSCADFINIAEVTKKYLRPDENLSLFHNYQKENDKAQNAYLYLLFEYELLDQVQVFLDDEEESDFTKFRALHQLKQMSSKYKLEDIIDIHTICSESRFI